MSTEQKFHEFWKTKKNPITMVREYTRREINQIARMKEVDRNIGH
jgi:hypothetical protein